IEHYQSKLLGENNVLNLCAALMVASYLGVSPEQRRRAVSKIQCVEHRLSISHQRGLTILDDAYNSNPEGAAMALRVLKEMNLPEGGKRIVITPGFVELGPEQQKECRTLGYRAAKSADILVIVNKLNREAIYGGAVEGGLDEKNIICADTLSEAVALVSPLTTPGSVLLYENDLPDMFK
ncbi:MAG: glutamate ligase domain-containing protein, partial [Candidatus Cryptobacteroides sp.]